MLKVPCVTELGSYPRSWWDQEPAPQSLGRAGAGFGLCCSETMGKGVGDAR